MLEQCNGCWPGCSFPGCPYYRPKGNYETCDICENYIYPDEKYIERDDGSKIHYDCMYDYTDEFLDWAGLSVGHMDYEEDYPED